ncbi:MAG: DUF1800 domain-containing protein [Anaerolineae bacterium]|nr:DUF1800 domain-containing protein [Anaerolineae bacterium]
MHRREFFKVFGLSSAGLALSATQLGTVLAQVPSGAFSPDTRDPVSHVLNRMGFGPTPDLYEYANRIGVDAYIEEQLAAAGDDAVLEQLIERRLPIMNMTTADIFERYRDKRGDVVEALIGSTLIRAILTANQLHEVMVHFWSNHFNIYINKEASVFLKVADDRDVIRPHALGKFRDLLRASATSPAMLFYLDNAQSTGQEPNENYGRELLELHTLGVDGGYTEEDVKQAALAFTGWSIVPPRELEARNDVQVGEFLFRGRAHANGPKTVLGVQLPGNGMADGEAVIDLLASHPSTARHISEKLVRRFVSDDPPEALVNAAAETFLQSDGDIKAVLRTILTSDAFWNAPPKFKQPFELVIGLLRGLSYVARNDDRLGRGMAQALQQMGHMPFMWPAPNGYPDDGRYWMNNLLPRWNLPISLLSDNRIGQPDYDRLAALAQTGDGDPFDALMHYFIGRSLTDAEQQVVSDFAAQVPGNDDAKTVASVALVLASPAYQYR